MVRYPKVLRGVAAVSVFLCPSTHSLYNNSIGDVGREALDKAAKEKGIKLWYDNCGLFQCTVKL